MQPLAHVITGGNEIDGIKPILLLPGEMLIVLFIMDPPLFIGIVTGIAAVIAFVGLVVFLV